MRDIRVYWNCMYLFSVWRKNGAISERGYFNLKQKNNVWGGFSGPIQILIIFWRGFGGFQWRKNGEEIERRVSIVKCQETPFEGLWKSCRTLHVWRSYENCLRRSTHTESHYPIFSLITNKSRRYTNLVFFNLDTPSWTTTSDISKWPQVRFLIV